MRRPLALVAALLALLATPAQAAPCAGFADVDTSSPHCADVEWLRNRNVTQGCTATLFCPDATVSRLQMAIFLRRFGTTMAAMHWVDPVDAVVGRAGPGATLELTVAAQRVLVGLEPVDPSGYRLRYDAVFDFEGPGCTGRRYFLSKGGNAGARTLAVVAPAPFGVNYAYLSGPLNPSPFIASRGDMTSGTLACAELPAPGLASARHEAVGPFALPAIAFPLHLR